MKKFYICVIVLVASLTSCAPSEKAIQTAIFQTEEAKPTSTSTPEGTATISPTPTEEIPIAKYYKSYQAEDSVWGLAWSVDNQFLMLQKYINDLTVWAVEYGNFWPPINDKGTLIQRPFSGVWSPDGKYFAVRNRWDFFIMDALGTEAYFDYESGVFTDKLVWSTDSSLLAEILSNDNILIVEIATFQVQQTISNYSDVNYVDFSPDGSMLAIQGNNQLDIIDLDTEEILVSYPTLLSINWSPDGKKLAGMDWSSLKIINLESNEILSYPSSDYFGIGNLHIDWSPDGRYIASAHKDGTVRLWNAKDPTKYIDLIEPDSSVITVSFSMDGKYLAAGEDDGTVIIWELD